MGIGLLLIAPGSALAQQSASITLRGYVPETSTIKLQDVNSVVSRDIRVPLRNALIARVLERSNAHAGYKIMLISKNGTLYRKAAFFHSQTNAALPYRLSYDGAELRFVEGKAEIRRRERTRRRSRQGELRITTAESSRLPAGAYSDTITIAITAP
jgi:hypothetical protein